MACTFWLRFMYRQALSYCTLHVVWYHVTMLTLVSADLEGTGDL